MTGAVSKEAATIDARGQGLLAAIREGSCVAFVGAGFTAPSTGTWKDLLLALARSADGELASQIQRRLEPMHPRAFDYEASAEALREHLGEQRFVREVDRALDKPAGEIVESRLRRLRGIPFRAILTVNFDRHLRGESWGETAYRAVLRPEQGKRWWAERYWGGDEPEGAPVVKLHGDAERGEIVFSTRDYRQQLYTDLSYLTFVRAVLATTTVLYLGFSFTDAYLNQLRSEILAMVGSGSDHAPVAYAIVNDASDDDVAHFRRHEGIQLLPYDAAGGHGGFDAYLQAIWERTRPGAMLAEATAGRRILWLDPSPASNAWGWGVLESGATGRRPELVQVGTVDEALGAMARRSFDLVITHWGHGGAVVDGDRVSVAERLLREMPAAHRAPVIVFCDEQHAAENRAKALRLGAFELAATWPQLFEAIVRVLR